jgi:5-methylcytosine-specific restriction endonuclease McrA
MPKLGTLKPRLPVLDSRTARPAPKVADRFYSTTAWTELRASLIRQRGAYCEDCGRAASRLFADHVIELKDGGAALDPSNVRLSCGSCHGLKTARVRAERQRR